jgi:hypothetical protein
VNTGNNLMPGICIPVLCRIPAGVTYQSIDPAGFKHAA